MHNKKAINILLSSTLALSLANPVYANTLLKYGMRGSEVRQLQVNLNRAGYFVTANPTDYFGPATRNAVIRLQKDFHLTPDGIVGPLTQKALLEKLNANIPSRSGINRNVNSNTNQNSTGSNKNQNSSNSATGSNSRSVLKYGMQGDDVKQLQAALAKLGYFVGSAPTGFFGSLTQDAVVRFQKANKLTPDGIVGPLTQKAIQQLLASKEAQPSTPPKSSQSTQPQPDPPKIQYPSGFSRDMKKGDNGDDVKLLQSMLKEIGYYTKDINGIYDDNTVNAVTDFQKYYSLTVNGVSNLDTIKKIIEIDNEVKQIKGFYIKGKGGYGHGVGMTQFGMEGMAEQGYKYDEIIKYYYTGVNIEKRNTDVNIKVKLSLDRPDIEVTSDQPYTVQYTTVDKNTGQAVINNMQCPANSITTFKYVNGFIAFTNDKILDNSATPIETDVLNPVTVIPSDTGILEYMHNNNFAPYEGTFEVYPDNNSKSLYLINILPLEEYLKGVIPAEIPYTWQPEAIKAQILAARTYALRNISDTHIFDVYDSTLSQAYGGLSVDNPGVDALIDATKGEVVTYNGSLADTVYSASAGGYTVDASFVWGNDVPYLKGKPDPFDNSKYATYWWNVNITRAQMSSLYPQLGTILNVEITQKMFERPLQLKITGTKGSIIVSSRDFMNAIGKKLFVSDFYSVDVLKQ